MSNSENLFVPPEFDNHSPLTWYQAASQKPGFIRDEAQARAIEHLDRLWTVCHIAVSAGCIFMHLWRKYTSV